nr:hypothetical protein [uncultured Carboxylicivirga sp.]
MRKLIYILSGLLILSQFAFGQNLMYSSREKTAISLPDYNLTEYSTEIDSENNLPDSLQRVIKKHLKHRTLTNYKNLKFYKATIFDLGKYYSENPERINSNLSFIPKIGIIYMWTDFSLGIQNFPIVLSLDQYGQILKFTFPDLSIYKSTELISLDQAKSLSDSILNRYGYESQLESYYLEFDSQRQSLDWHLCYKTDRKDEIYKSLNLQIPITEKWCERIYTTFYPELIDDTEIEEEILEIKDKNGP